jgi:hypothetical protein
MQHPADLAGRGAGRLLALRWRFEECFAPRPLRSISDGAPPWKPERGQGAAGDPPFIRCRRRAGAAVFSRVDDDGALALPWRHRPP